MNIATPIAMLAGRGSGPALLVAGLLLAAWIAKQAKEQQTAGR
jgi:hypothetical protein